MPRPKAMYIPHTLNAQDIPAEERYVQISKNLSCYGIDILNNRRPEEITAHHTTISGIHGDFCSAKGSSNITVYDPYKSNESFLYISLLVHGNQEITGKNKDGTVSISPGSLILHHRADYYHYKANNVKQLYIVPNSLKVNDIFQGKFQDTIVSLENHHLADFLKLKMLLLDQRAEQLSPKETALVVDSMHNVAQLMISDIASEKGLISLGKQSIIYNNATSYILQNFHDVELSPEKLSQYLRCSRASLDRAFKEQNTSVMNVIKNIRLEAAQKMLISHKHLRIEQISWRCGFINHALFSKNFREKYYMSPKGWRDNFDKQ